jgi:hypothetical protein
MVQTSINTLERLAEFARWLDAVCTNAAEDARRGDPHRPWWRWAGHISAAVTSIIWQLRKLK